LETYKRILVICKEAATYEFDPFYVKYVEQAVFTPSNFVPGISPSSDRHEPDASVTPLTMKKRIWNLRS
jgi:hypothetical protein